MALFLTPVPGRRRIDLDPARPRRSSSLSARSARSPTRNPGAMLVTSPLTSPPASMRARPARSMASPRTRPPACCCASAGEAARRARARRVRWAELGHASLFAFLHRQLGLSRGASHDRSAAARLVRRHPAVARALREGERCLSSVVDLGRADRVHTHELALAPSGPDQGAIVEAANEPALVSTAPVARPTGSSLTTSSQWPAVVRARWPTSGWSGSRTTERRRGGSSAKAGSGGEPDHLGERGRAAGRVVERHGPGRSIRCPRRPAPCHATQVAGPLPFACPPDIGRDHPGPPPGAVPPIEYGGNEQG